MNVLEATFQQGINCRTVHTLVAVRFNHCAGSEATSGNNLTTIVINGGISCGTGNPLPVVVLCIGTTLCSGIHHTTGSLRSSFYQLSPVFINDRAGGNTAAVYPLCTTVKRGI